MSLTSGWIVIAGTNDGTNQTVADGAEFVQNLSSPGTAGIPSAIAIYEWGGSSFANINHNHDESYDIIGAAESVQDSLDNHISGTNQHNITAIIDLSGTLSALADAIAGASGGLSDWQLITTNYVGTNGDRLVVDSSSGTLSISLPLNPSFGNEIDLVDKGNTWGTNTVTLDRNGGTIGETAGTDMYLNVDGASLKILCVDGTTHTWQPRYY